MTQVERRAIIGAMIPESRKVGRNGKRLLIEVSCLDCGNRFMAKPSHLDRGHAKYCSKVCWYKNSHPVGSVRTIPAKSCPHCGKEFLVHHQKRQKYCSMECRNHYKSGPNNPSWKGGRVNHAGYVEIYNPKHPQANAAGRVREHRLVMEQMIGRSLLKNESPHHLNGIRSDNRPENLELWARVQPSGQRVSDMVRFLVEHHRALVEEALLVKP